MRSRGRDGWRGFLQFLRARSNKTASMFVGRLLERDFGLFALRTCCAHVRAWHSYAHTRTRQLMRTRAHGSYVHSDCGNKVHVGQGNATLEDEAGDNIRWSALCTFSGIFRYHGNHHVPWYEY